MYVRDVTPVPPLALALFGGPLAAESRTGVLIVDGWIELAVPTRLHQPLLAMRKRLDDLFAGWLVERGVHGKRDQKIMTEHGGAELLESIVELLNKQEETAP